jgi:hypothetical protein
VAQTSWYGWSQIDQWTRPFYAAFDTLANQIDATVNCLAAGQFQPRVTVVLSGCPTAAANIACTTNPGGGTWVTLSAAPQGAYHGWFTVTESGVNVRFDLTTRLAVKSTAGPIKVISATVFIRLLHQNGSDLGTGSFWAIRAGISETWQTPALSCVASLGIGTHSLAVQVRGGASVNESITVSSASPIHLVANVVPR